MIVTGIQDAFRPGSFVPAANAGGTIRRGMLRAGL